MRGSWRLVAGTCAVLGVWGPAAAQPAAVSFARDVAPLVARHCAACHRESGDAPFAFATAGAVRDRAATIAAVVARRYMPPWKPDPEAGVFAGSTRMPDAAIETIRRWAETGGPLDVPADAPIAVDEGLERLPPPDVEVTLPVYRLRAEGSDVFRNFVVPVPLDRARYVRALVFRPRGSAVHHANIRVDPTRASRRLDDADPDSGYDGVILRSADFPDGHFLGWTPGQRALQSDAALAWRLEAGADLVVQLHMRPTGRVESVAPTIALYFTDEAPARRPVMLRLGHQTLAIPAGEAAYRVRDDFVLPVAAELHVVQPHAHFRARQVEAWATRPDGSREPLLRIADWDARWQDRYRYQSPIHLPAGSRVEAEYLFDNSAANPRNPVSPPVRAEWGWRTSDEMGDVWFQLLAADDRARLTLLFATRQKMQAEDALGCEVLLAREPNHIALRNDAALIYMALGRPAEALRHYQAVTRLEPAVPSAWFNEGVALEALGRSSEAMARYREALARDPEYSAANNNLGALLLREGHMDEARPLIVRAVQSDTTNTEARANLALVELLGGDSDRAVAGIDEVLRLNPEMLGTMTPFAQLLAAHPVASARRPDAARDLAARIVAATGRADAAAIDALAMAHAALGDFVSAIREATEALSRSGEPLATAIRTRLAGYRQRQPFVLPR